MRKAGTKVIDVALPIASIRQVDLEGDGSNLGLENSWKPGGVSSEVHGPDGVSDIEDTFTSGVMGSLVSGLTLDDSVVDGWSKNVHPEARLPMHQQLCRSDACSSLRGDAVVREEPVESGLQVRLLALLDAVLDGLNSAFSKSVGRRMVR